MTIKKMSMYQTSDGKQYTDRNQAKQHEAELTALSELRHALRESIATTRAAAVIEQMIGEEEMVRAILNNYHKHLPKPEIVEEDFAKAA